MTNPIALALHGGAGALSPDKYTPEQIHKAKALMRRLLLEGNNALEAGAGAGEVVISTVMGLENDSLFNAGRGAVFNREGEIELDSSYMECQAVTEHTFEKEIVNFGAGLSCLTTIKNPILGAYELAKAHGHALLAGKGAEEFCLSLGLKAESREYFKTEHRWLQHLEYLKTKKLSLDHGNTVGAVALDQQGKLAAGTSTGGMNGKARGRISDSAIIGAGTWADVSSLAVSGTGTGDHFVRLALCRYIHDLMTLKSQEMDISLVNALNLLKSHGGEGGFVAVNGRGQVSMPYNTGGMFRGSISSDKELYVAIWDT